jgi:hypothetical protein
VAALGSSTIWAPIPFRLEITEVVDSARATHIYYRVVNDGE